MSSCQRKIYFPNFVGQLNVLLPYSFQSKRTIIILFTKQKDERTVAQMAVCSPHDSKGHEFESCWILTGVFLSLTRIDGITVVFNSYKL